MPAVAESVTVPTAQSEPNAAGFQPLCHQLEQYLEPDEVRRVYRAYLFSADRHADQHRETGEAYIHHPLSAALTLAELHLDADTIAAALLHDVMEDTPTARDQIVQEFGGDVAHLVDGVSKLTQLGDVSRTEAMAANFSKMMLATVQDLRVILVKLADRLHNMRTLHGLHTEKRQRIARETLEVYVPISRRLGMNTICQELEQCAFEALYPLRSQVLAAAMQERLGQRRIRVEKTREALLQCLAEKKIKAQVEGREKSVYSVYCKMRDKQLSFAEVFDVYGFRIVVDNVDHCYQVLGLMHGLYKPVPGKFKDYIAIPKENGYQSLHTVLFGPGGGPLEIQIRTRAMEQMAEGGVAAHWKYKSGDHRSLPPHVESWVQSILELKRSVPNSQEFLEQVKVDLFPYEVYVFTPAGDIRSLPAGATAVDFAYDIHSDIGNTCVGVYIDRIASPLSTELVSGQTVQVQTSEQVTPSPAWLDFVVTAKARSAIRQRLKSLQERQAVDVGQRLLNEALAPFDIAFDELSEKRIAEVLDEMERGEPEALFRDIGLGRLIAPMVAHRLVGESRTQRSVGWLDRLLRRRQDQPLALQGTEGMAVTFARCCHPIPGDPVIGSASAGHGLVIHRNGCSNLSKQRKSPEQWIPCKWATEVHGEYPTSIRVTTANHSGLLARIAAAIADQGCNITGVDLDAQQARNINVGFVLNVRDRVHLANIIKAVRRLPDVSRVVRLTG